MEKGVLTPCTTRKEWDLFFFFYQKAERKCKLPNGFLMLKLCHMLLVTVNIYIYLYSYMYIKKGKIIYRTVSSQRHLEKSKNKSFFLKTDLLKQLHTQRTYNPYPLMKPWCYS